MNEIGPHDYLACFYQCPPCSSGSSAQQLAFFLFLFLAKKLLQGRMDWLGTGVSLLSSYSQESLPTEVCLSLEQQVPAGYAQGWPGGFIRALQSHFFHQVL